MIVRRNRNRNFTVLNNQIVDDDRLGAEAIGLMAYLLSRPDDWSVHVDQLRGRFKLGRDKVRRLLNELIEAGYIQRQKRRDVESKAFVGDEYIVYDEPHHPISGEPGTENQALDRAHIVNKQPGPGTGFQSLAEVQAEDRLARDVFAGAGKASAGISGPILRTDSHQELKDNKTPKPPKGAGGGISFDDFWSKWPVEPIETDTAARRAWAKLSADDQQSAIDGVARYLAACQGLGRKVCHGRTYLAERRWAGLEAAPPMDGKHYVITPDRPEWGPWLGHLRRVHGESAVGEVVKRKRFLASSVEPPEARLGRIEARLGP